MPLSKLQFRPGINKESTNYSNEGGFWACDKIRFRSGFPEKIGGWVNQSTNTFYGVARNLWNWVTYSSQNLMAVGTSQKYYIENSGIYHDITPVRTTTTLGVTPISTTSGSKVITVTATGHGASAGTFVKFSFGSAVTVGGIPITTFDSSTSTYWGEFEIVTVPTSNTFTITYPTAATSTATGGTSLIAAFQINAGNSATVASTGWGTGAWGSSGWGLSSGTGIATPIRLWSQDNFEQDLILNPYGGSIYYWTKDTSTYAPAILLSTYANSINKFTTITLAASGIGTTILYVQSTDGIDPGAVVTDGASIPAGTYVTSLGNYVPASNSFEVNISAALTGIVATSTTLNFSYAGQAVPNTSNFVIASDTSHFAISLGANPYDPTDFNTTFDPMLVRWSDQGDPAEWTPRPDNQSGEQHLSNGSYLVAAQNTRQEILLWSDAALFSMQYLGPPYVYGFNLLMDNISIASPNSMVTVNSVTFWMGVDKFYMYSGRVETLPCTLRNFVFTNINRTRMNQIVCGTNEGYNEVWWFYPSANSTVNDSYIIYNHLERIWYYGSMNRTAWIDSPLRTSPQGAFSVQNSYLSADITSTATSITLLDTSSYPSSGVITLDSEQVTYTGITGNTLTGCVRGANSTTAASHLLDTKATYYIPNQLMYHEYGYDDLSGASPAPIAAYIESSDFDIGDGHNFGFVWRMLPDLTFDGSTANPPDCKVLLTLKARSNSGSAYIVSNSPTVTATYPVSADQYTGEVFTRVRGRQMAFKMSSADLGVTWQLGAPRIDIRPDGRR